MPSTEDFLNRFCFLSFFIILAVKIFAVWQELKNWFHTVKYQFEMPLEEHVSEKIHFGLLL